MNSIGGVRLTEVASAAKDSEARSESAGDGRLGGLLDSLSGQVTVAFSQLGELHADLCAQRRAALEREHELRQRGELLEREMSELAELRASLAATDEALKGRSRTLEEQESEVATRREDLAREAKRVAELGDDLARRAALVERRERAIDQFHALLGRMQTAVVAPSEETVAAAAAVVEANEQEPSAPEQTTEADAPPLIDLSDFSEEELATFGVRRRLRAYSDAFLAAEIRSERTESKTAKKRRGWF